MADTMTFGARLRDARKEAGYSAQWVVNYLNGYLIGAGLQTVNINTYYSWEKIGTPGEVKRGKRYPHPVVYRNLMILFGVTGYWLWMGSLGGKIVRRRSDLPGIEHADSLGSALALEQRAAVASNHDELFREFQRVTDKISATQRAALLNMLRSIR